MVLLPLAVGVTVAPAMPWPSVAVLAAAGLLVLPAQCHAPAAPIAEHAAPLEPPQRRANGGPTAAAAEASSVASHLVHMTFYTHPDPLQVSIMAGWITAVNEQGTAAGAVHTFSNFSIPSLMGQLPCLEPPQRPGAVFSRCPAALQQRGQPQPWRVWPTAA